MRTSLQYLSMIGAAACLMACAETGQHGEPARAAASAPSFANADQAYLVGRGHHLAQRFDAAIGAYQAALRIAPEHVNARNGLATLYAEQGRFDQAIPLWKALIEGMSGQIGPESGFLFSNLGYAMFLNGDYDGALAALEKACLTDPLNHRAWQHLGDALAKLGQDERAAVMHRQAAALKAHDFKADYAVARRAGVAPIDSAVAVADAAQADLDDTRLEKTASGMFVMRRVAARRADLAAPVPIRSAAGAGPVAAPVPATASAKLEISNGNGVTGMARALSKTMAADEWRVVRLTNQKSFAVSHTRVEYGAEFRDAAERLAARFGAAKAVPVANVGRADLRLVIGRDLVKPGAARPTMSADAGAGRPQG